MEYFHKISALLFSVWSDIIVNMKKFTSVQFLLIILAIVIFLGALFFIVNPSKRFAKMRNDTRRSDAQNILNAIYQYTMDNNSLPSSITESPKMICRTKAVSCEGLIDLSEIVAQKKYISAIPVDPSEKDLNSSGYEIYKSANGRINIIAIKAENNATISLSK